MPGLRIRASIGKRPSTTTATRSASLAASKLMTSLNDPPEANCASFAGDQRVVGGREAGDDLDVEAQLVVVAALLGDEHIDHRRRRGEVEAGQVRDRPGVAVGGAAFVREPFAGDDGRVRRLGRRAGADECGDRSDSASQRRRVRRVCWIMRSITVPSAVPFALRRRRAGLRRCDTCQRSSTRSISETRPRPMTPSSDRGEHRRPQRAALVEAGRAAADRAQPALADRR